MGKNGGKIVEVNSGKWERIFGLIRVKYKTKKDVLF